MKRWYEESVGLHLTRAARLHRSRAQAILREMGLYPGQETVLQVLLEDDGQPMSTLARELKVRPPTVTKMVTRMAAQGLLVRLASERDARSATVHLTQAGRERATELKQRWKALEQETLAKLDGKDRKRLVKLLSAIEKALAEEPPRRPKTAKTAARSDEESD
ncbi:MarR family winged helix-turn-helix transcriptional regulator [Lutibaculum baratangense]|uniref:Transcriptional regulator, MarR family n=1 Tax=Lutibaculum baratangense AMV1 TaxID=631454 RepID=V4RLP3_9HYPH|nr:MarR family winged helix-turn-helix transcriptional regulator [Lutibaculum baratangense]ESR26239.1 Transcriptional regulator, MarR family [Lutibaculum baratangense AMV1]